MFIFTHNHYHKLHHQPPLLAQLLPADSHPQAAPASALPENCIYISSGCPSRLSAAFGIRPICYELATRSWEASLISILYRDPHVSLCQVLCYACWSVRPRTERQRSLTFEDKLQYPSWSFLCEVESKKEKFTYKNDTGHKTINKHWTVLSIQPTACHYGH